MRRGTLRARDSDSGLTMDGLTEVLDEAVQGFEASLNDEEEQEARQLMQEEGRDLTKETLLTYRFPLGLQRVALGPDQWGGRGVFAVRDIGRGELITCMPADIAIHDASGDELWGEHVAEEQFEDSHHHDTPLADYQISEGDDFTLVGLPSLCDDPSYLGQFINDAEKLDVSGDVPPSQDDVSRYEAASEAGRNAEHTSLYLHMATVATRDIPAGEEVFVSYGADYWIEHARRRKTEP